MNPFQNIARKLLPRGRFARNVSILAGGTALSQALAVMAAPILTRLYSVEDFGYFQIYISIMAFCSLAVTLRYEQAIFLPEKEEVAANVFAITLLSVAVMSLIAAVAAVAIQRVNLLPRSIEPLRRYLWLIPLGICGAGIYQSLSFWALRQKAYGRISGTKITQVGGLVTTQASLGFLHTGPVGLLLGDIVGRTAGSVNLARFAWEKSRNLLRAIRGRGMWYAAVRYRHFPTVSTGAALIGVAATAFPPILMAQLYGAKVLGWYALGDRVLGAPALLVGQAVSQVFSVEAAGLSNSDPSSLRTLFLRSIKRLLLLGIIPFLLFVFFGPGLFQFVFGKAWREAGVYAQLLALMHYVAFVGWPMTPTLNVLEEQFWQLGWDAGRLVLTLSSLWFAHHWGWSATGAIASFGGAMLVGYVVHMLLSYRAIMKKIRHSHTIAVSELQGRPGVCPVC